MNFLDLMCFFFLYGFLGWCTEVGYAGVKQGKFVNRGFLNGPICPIYGVGLCVVIGVLTPLKDNLILLYLTSTILVTILEGVTGYAMDKIFHNKWWDYTDQPWNIGGYVCLVFSLIWGVACVIVIDFVHPFVKLLLDHVPFIIKLIAVLIFSVALLADLYVTASAIFKLNKRLEMMDKIASELHELSEQLGEEIFNQVSEAMEIREIPEEASARVKELKKKYRELVERRSKVSRRLVHAFPKMKSRMSNEQLNKLRERIMDWKK